MDEKYAFYQVKNPLYKNNEDRDLVLICWPTIEFNEKCIGFVKRMSIEHLRDQN